MSAHPQSMSLPSHSEKIWRITKKRNPQRQSIWQKPCFVYLRVLLLPFIVLLQNKHTTRVENGENLISTQPRISAHSQGPNI